MRSSSNQSTRLFVVSALTLGGLAAGTWFLGSLDAAQSEAAVVSRIASDLGQADARGTDDLQINRGSRAVADAAERPGFYWLPVGRRFDMSFETSSSSRVRFQEDSGTASLSMTFAGRTDVVVVAEDEEVLVLELAPRSIEASFVTSEGSADPAATSLIAQAIEKPCWFRMDRFGHVTGYRFAEGVDAQTRNIQRTIVATVTAEFSTDDAEQWTAERADASGPFEVDYAWEARPEGDQPGALAFKKLSQDTEAEDGTLEIVGSEGAASVDGSLCWLTRVEYTESLRLAVPSADTTVRVTTESTAELMETSMEKPSAIPFDWSEPWSPASGARDADEPEPFATTASRKLAELGVEGIALRIEELIQAGEFSSYEIVEAEHALKLLMLKDPAAVEALKALIEGGVLSPRAESVLLAAAGMAATPEAQGLLATTFSDSEAPDERRRAAAFSMVQLERPSGEVLASLSSSVQSEGLSPELMSTSLLMLGAASSRMQGEERESLLETLLGQEERARREGRLSGWLGALGNAGMPESLPRIEPYFTHADWQLRATACGAVRKLMGEEATDLLTRALRDDEEEGVRRAAAENLAPRNVKSVNLFLRQRLQQETSANVLAEIVDGIASRRPFDRESELLLRNFANTTSEPSLRERALAAVAAKS